MAAGRTFLIAIVIFGIVFLAPWYLASGQRQNATCAMEVAEDSSRFSFTCQVDIKDSQVAEVLRSPTVDEEVDVSSSGFRLVGGCHGGRQKVCGSQIPNLFAVTYTKGKGLTVASVLPVERNNTGGVWMCRISEDNSKGQKMLTLVSLCRIDVIYAPSSAVTVCRVKVRQDDWSVEGSCFIPKSFSFLKNYTCHWHVAERSDIVVPKETTAYSMKSYVDPGNKREYRSGVCSFKHQLPRFVSAVYLYQAVFFPGQVVAKAPLLSIVAPSPPIARCATIVKKGDASNCTCETHDLGTPAGRLVWKVREKVLVRGAPGQTVLPLVSQQANANTDVTCMVEWARNLAASRTIMAEANASAPSFASSRQRVAKDNWLSGTHAYQADFASGQRQRAMCAMEVAEDSSRFSFTCQVDIKDNQAAEVLRSPTVDEEVDVSSSGFRLVGGCHGGRQKVCGSQFPDLFAVTYTRSTGLTVASVLPVERNSTGGVWMCRLSEDNGKGQKVLTLVSLCRTDVIYAPSPADIKCWVKVREDDWSVEGSCFIPKTFSFLKNYTCHWHVAKSLDTVVPKETTAYSMKSYVDPGNKRAYRSGVCSFKHQLPPFVNAAYTYYVVFFPGQVVAEAPLLNIVAPSQPTAVCATSVKRGDASNCTCKASDLGTPAGRLVWKVGEKVLVRGAPGQTELPLVSQQATANTDVTCMVEWARNFVTNRAVVADTEESIRSFTINGQSGEVVVKENSSVSFECSVTGKPSPIIRLIKGDYPISAGKQLGAIQQSQSLHRVTIAAVSCRDAGSYTCAARQGVAERVRYGRLLVECAPQLTTPTNKSTFREPLHLVYNPPESHSLQVHILGYPLPGNPEVVYLGQRDTNRLSKGFGICTDCPNATCLNADDDAGNKVVCFITARNIRPEHTGLYILRLSNIWGVVEIPFLVKSRRPETLAVRPKMAAAIVVLCVVAALMCVCAALVLQARRLPRGKEKGSSRAIFKGNSSQLSVTLDTQVKENAQKPDFKRDRQQTSETLRSQNAKSRNHATVQDNNSQNKETRRSDRILSLSDLSENAMNNTSRNKDARVNVWILSLEDSGGKTLSNDSTNNDTGRNMRMLALESSNRKILDNCSRNTETSRSESILSIKESRVNDECCGTEKRSSLEGSSGKVKRHSYCSTQSNQKHTHTERSYQNYASTAGDIHRSVQQYTASEPQQGTYENPMSQDILDRRCADVVTHKNLVSQDILDRRCADVVTHKNLVSQDTLDRGFTDVATRNFRSSLAERPGRAKTTISLWAAHKRRASSQRESRLAFTKAEHRVKSDASLSIIQSLEIEQALKSPGRTTQAQTFHQRSIGSAAIYELPAAEPVKKSLQMTQISEKSEQDFSTVQQNLYFCSKQRVEAEEKNLEQKSVGKHEFTKSLESVYELGSSPRDNNTSAWVSVHDLALISKDKGTADSITPTALHQNSCKEISYRTQCSASRSKVPEQMSTGSQNSVYADISCTTPPAELCSFASADPVRINKYNTGSSLKLKSSPPEKLWNSAPSGLRTHEKGRRSLEDYDVLPENIANVRGAFLYETDVLLQPDETDFSTQEIQDRFPLKMAPAQAVSEDHSRFLSAGSVGSDKRNVITTPLHRKTLEDRAKKQGESVADELSSSRFPPAKEERWKSEGHNHLNCQETIIPQSSFFDASSTEGSSRGASSVISQRSPNSSETYKKNPLQDELINEFRHAVRKKNLGQTMTSSVSPGDSNGEGTVSGVPAALEVHEMVPHRNVHRGIQNGAYRELAEPPKTARSVDTSEDKPVQVFYTAPAGLTMYSTPNDNKKSTTIERKRSWKCYKKSRKDSGHYRMASSNQDKDSGHYIMASPNQDKENGAVSRTMGDCSSSECSSSMSDFSYSKPRTGNRVRKLFKDLQNKAKDYVFLSPSRSKTSNNFIKNRRSCQSKSDYCGTKTKSTSSKIPKLTTDPNVGWQNSHREDTVGLISEDDQDRWTSQKIVVSGDMSKRLKDMGKVKKVRSKLHSGTIKRIFSMNRSKPKAVTATQSPAVDSYVAHPKGNMQVKGVRCTPDNEFILGLPKPLCPTSNCENSKFSHGTEILKVSSRTASTCFQESNKIASETIPDTPVTISLQTFRLALEGDAFKDKVQNVHCDFVSLPDNSDNKDRVKVRDCPEDDGNVSVKNGQKTYLAKENSENPQAPGEDRLVLPLMPSENNVQFRNISAATSLNIPRLQLKQKNEIGILLPSPKLPCEDTEKILDSQVCSKQKTTENSTISSLVDKMEADPGKQLSTSLSEVIKDRDTATYPFSPSLASSPEVNLFTSDGKRQSAAGMPYSVHCALCAPRLLEARTKGSQLSAKQWD